MNKATRILNLIASHPEGMKFTEIQKALWEMSHSEPFTREQRGWWCTALMTTFKDFYGPPTYGLLPTFCVKGRDGRWHRNRRAHHDRPWATINEMRRRMMRSKPKP